MELHTQRRSKTSAIGQRNKPPALADLNRWSVVPRSPLTLPLAFLLLHARVCSDLCFHFPNRLLELADLALLTLWIASTAAAAERHGCTAQRRREAQPQRRQ